MNLGKQNQARNAQSAASAWLFSLLMFGCSVPVGTMKDFEDTGSQTAASVTFGGVMMSPAIIDFGEVALGATSVQSLTLTNESAAERMITTANIDSDRFSVADDVGFPLALDADESTTLGFMYTPALLNEEEGLLNIGVAGQVGYADINLFGRGTEEEIPPEETDAETGRVEANPSSVAFGSIPAMSSLIETIEVVNTGEVDITIHDFVSTLAPIFTVESQSAPPITIAPGESLDVDITFSPESEADHNAKIDIETDGDPEILEVLVTGSGTPPACEICAPQVEVMTSSGTSTGLFMEPAFGFGCTANGTIQLRNTGDQDLEVTAVNVMNNWFDLFSTGTFSASWGGPEVIEPGGQSTIAIDYVTDASTVEESDVATNQNVVHILSNDPLRPDVVVELSAEVLFCF